MRSLLNKIVLLLIVLLLTLSCIAGASAEDTDTPAKDLTSYLSIRQDEGHKDAYGRLKIDNLYDFVRYAAYETISLSWEKATERPAYLCIQWYTLPYHVELRQLDQNGTMLSEEPVGQTYDTVVSLSPETASVTITPQRTGMSITRIALYSEGTLPPPFFPWKDTPHGMDYLVVATHPDDDTLFMGGIVPTYGAEQGYVGTIAYVTKPARLRVQEALLGAWEMGTVYYPLFLEFEDVFPIGLENHFLPEVVTLAFVRMLREYRPLVVVSHDLNGEYGHPQHKIVSASIVDACRLAADPTYDRSSYEQFGTWEVKKCYLHLYPENQFEMDMNKPLAAFGGRTALEVARDAFQKHRSQTGGAHYVHDETGLYPVNRLGMAYGTVDAGSDLFDNIDPTLFASYIPPESTPEPAPEQTQEPTSVPTQKPAAVPTAEPASDPTPVPTQSSETKTGAKDILLPILYALIGAAIASGCFLLFRRRKRS